MANSDILLFSSSPHVKSPKTTKWIMLNVCIALLPSLIFGIIYFGLKALLLVAVSVLSAVVSEFIYLFITGKKFDEIVKQFDYSSCVTGLLIGLTIGTNYPIYAPIFGSAFAIIVVKMLFGGTGKNIVNPAIVGRIFIFISFQTVITAYLSPNIASISGKTLDTSATALAGLLGQDGVQIFPNLSNWDLFLGTGLSGCIGETCKLAILIGAVYLACVGILNILYPIIYVIVCGLFTVLLNGFDFAFFLPSILSGGLMIGAFFMATDYVTTPNTKIANYIYFFILGLLTAGLRQATHMEVVSFAILLMNLTVPIIDKFIYHRPFGYYKPKKEAK
ncbi:MAG: RnfABCDGE type electron transport complex subunit D [Clostridia bacterium]|nr:RnfABCDGE type electron transport complex subunit D [Clostridia bacterium]